MEMGRHVRLIISLLVLLAPLSLYGQRGPQAPPPTAKAIAPVDLTGYWISIVTSDWRHRMLPPLKGDYESIPLTAEGRKVADSWNPAADQTSGNQCKAYGAAGLMRIPGRLHITWQDDNTLRIDTDAGTRTRLFHFGVSEAPNGERRLEGYSIGRWEAPTVSAGIGPRPNLRKLSGSLEVNTTNMLPGYLRRNGVPYSERATLTEYFTQTGEPDGSTMLFIQTIVVDPVYLDQPFITSTSFKKQADGTGWNPTPCGL
jgi:hypothetical protein